MVIKEEERTAIDAKHNNLPCRFVLAVTRKGTADTILRARFAIDGHRGKQKHSIIHNAYASLPQSLLLLLSIAAFLGFDVWSLDADQAYLQTIGDLGRDVYMRTNAISLSKTDLVKILRQFTASRMQAISWLAPPCITTLRS